MASSFYIKNKSTILTFSLYSVPLQGKNPSQGPAWMRKAGQMDRGLHDGAGVGGTKRSRVQSPHAIQQKQCRTDGRLCCRHTSPGTESTSTLQVFLGLSEPFSLGLLGSMKLSWKCSESKYLRPQLAEKVAPSSRRIKDF